MRTKITFFLILTLIGLIPLLSFAQTPEQKPLRPFQLSFVPLIGTDGTQTPENRYQVSLNLLAGMTGGIKGFEVGGFGNITRGSMEGLQAAGFANLVLGDVKGIQITGFANMTIGRFEGPGIAGFANVITGSAQGILAAGFSNFNLDYFQGVQAAGFMNLSAEMQGLQAGGFMNITGNFRGFQAAGFMNLARDYQGFQAGGFMNLAQDMEGFQAAGFMNIARDFHGLQAAGFLNLGRRVTGTQLGFINFADTITGVPVGFLSVVRKGGYRALEVAASDAMFISGSLKIGVRQFYNIFTFGSRPFDKAPLSGLGYGIGTNINLQHESVIQLELHSTRLFEFGIWDPQQVNQLTELRTMFLFPAGERMNIFAGPVLYNQLIREDPVAGIEGLSIAPYILFDHHLRQYYSQWWLGARLGIQFRID